MAFHYSVLKDLLPSFKGACPLSRTLSYCIIPYPFLSTAFFAFFKANFEEKNLIHCGTVFILTQYNAYVKPFSTPHSRFLKLFFLLYPIMVFIATFPLLKDILPHLAHDFRLSLNILDAFQGNNRLICRILSEITQSTIT